MTATTKLTIGVDLGGTRVRAALVEEGRVIRRVDVPTDVAGGPMAVMEQICRLIACVCHPEDGRRVTGIGLCSTGPVDTENGIALSLPTLPNWEGFPVVETLAASLRLPVILENDGIAAAYGEWRYGAGRGCRHLVFVTVSTGVGGGVIADERVIRGRLGMAGHIGHMKIAPDGPVCSCGAHGCFEAFASGTALGRRAAARAADGGWLGQRAAAGDVVTARHVVEGADAGDGACLALLQEEARFLGIGISNLIHLFSPERVIIGGGVSAAFNHLESGIRDIIERDAIAPFKAVTLVRAALGDDAGLVGAAALAAEALAGKSPIRRRV